MADIKKVISLEYQIKGLQDIQNRTDKIKLFSGDSEVIKELERKTKELQILVSAKPNMMFDLNTAEEYSKRYKEVVALEEKARVQMIKLKDADSAATLEGYNEQIEAIEKQMELLDKKQDRVDTNLPTNKDGTKIIARYDSDRKEALAATVASGALSGSEGMRSMSGRKMTDSFEFLKNMKAIQEVLKGTQVEEDGILKKLKDGVDLSEQDLKILQKVVNEKALSGKKSDIIGLSAKEISEQYKNKNNLLEYEQLILQEMKNDRSAAIADQKEELQFQKEALEIEKSKAEATKKTIDTGDKDAVAIVELSTKIQKENTAAKIEAKVQDDSIRKAIKETVIEEGRAINSSNRFTKALKDKSGTIGTAVKQVITYGTTIKLVKKLYQETIKTIKDLDSALTEMAVVTSMTREQAWKLVPALQNIASETGFTTTEVAKLSTVYFRQGKTLKDVIELTTVAAKAARIAGISAQESADYLTSAVNGFGLAAKEALAVSDKFAALAASSASSYEELATGLSKFAAQANVAGISIDFAMGMLAKGVETTREAPETIGTALKTVIARMRELSDFGKTMEDGMNLNRVETALRHVGVQLTNNNGEFKDMQSVLTDVGNVWSTLNTTQQASVAVALAGTRQQSRLIAIMNDFDRTLELVNTAEMSSGATMAQHMEYMKSMEATITRLKNAWQKFITAITNSEVIIGAIRAIAFTLEGVVELVESLGIFGENLFSTIVSLVAINKAYTVVLGILTSLKIVDVALDEKGNQIKRKGFLSEILIVALAKIRERQLKRELVLNKLKIAKNSELNVSQKIQIKNQMKDIALTEVQIASAKKHAAAQLVKLGWIGLAIAATVAIIAITVKLVKISNDRIKKLKEERAELEKTIYETNKFSKEIDILIKKIEILNNKAIKTEVDSKELESLIEEIKQIEEERGIKIIVREGSEFDAKATLKNLKDLKAFEEKIVISSLKKVAEVTMKGYQQGISTAKQYANDLSNYEIAESRRKGNIINEQEKVFLKTYLQDKIAIEEQALKERVQLAVDFNRRQRDMRMADDGRTDEQIRNDELVIFYNNAKKYGKEMMQIQGEIASYMKEVYSSDIFSKQVKTFQEIRESLSTKKNTSFLKAYDEAFSNLNYVTKNFSHEIGEAFDILIGKIGTSSDSINNFNEKVQESGYDTTKILQAIIDRTDELRKENNSLSEEQLVSKAYSDIAGSIKDATLSTYIYGLVSKKTVLETSQSIDRISSSIKNFSETQEKMAKGELSKTELFNFIGDNSDIFENEEVLNRFLNGQDISRELIKASAEEYKNYENRLIAVNEELKKLEGSTTEKDIATRKSLNTEKAQITANLLYRNSLYGVTKAEYERNNLMMAYNRLSDLGIENDELRIKSLEALQEVTFNSIDASSEKIAGLKNDLNENLRDTTGNSESNWEEYIDIINGVAIINSKTFNNLSVDSKDFVTNFVDSFNSETDNIIDNFNQLKQESIAIKKEEVEKKKKIYEDYFSQLDKLENKRERKQSREDLTKQLQRLSGATDEVSRAKAKELQKELNLFDKESEKEKQKESRESLISSLDNEMVEFEEKWKNSAKDFIQKIAEGGSIAGKNIIEELKKAGLISKNYKQDSSSGKAVIENSGIVDNINNISNNGQPYEGGPLEDDGFKQGTDAEWKDEFYDFMEWAWYANKKFGPKSFDVWKSSAKETGISVGNFSEEDREALYSKMFKNKDLKDKNMPNNKKGGFEKWWLETAMAERIFSFKKGGIVDYTGTANVHGSKTQPEAFLNAKQTELFANLRDMLQKVSIDSNSSSGFVIENITIQTQELNNNQDFKKAGRTLADEFASAIKSRGLNLNVKR